MNSKEIKRKLEDIEALSGQAHCDFLKWRELTELNELDERRSIALQNYLESFADLRRLG